MAQQVSLRAPSFRVLALLLVLGGGCLGLFAGSLLAGSRGAAPTVKTDPYMDGQVADYVRRFGLDTEGASLVRIELEQMRAALRAKRNEILGRHQDELDTVSEATKERLKQIVKKHGTTAPAAGEGATSR